MGTCSIKDNRKLYWFKYCLNIYRLLSGLVLLYGSSIVLSLYQHHTFLITVTSCFISRKSYPSLLLFFRKKYTLAFSHNFYDMHVNFQIHTKNFLRFWLKLCWAYRSIWVEITYLQCWVFQSINISSLT